MAYVDISIINRFSLIECLHVYYLVTFRGRLNIFNKRIGGTVFVRNLFEIILKATHIANASNLYNKLWLKS